ncbi:MAG: 50S ribosomal protein L40e [Nanoarchaeota archaeon]|nr:50S ribosomal protein L40e [Nanoarchaeota archaeon]
MAKGKFPDAEQRLFQRVFVCRACGAKLRADPPKVKSGKVKCRKCHKRELRPIHKDKK